MSERPTIRTPRWIQLVVLPVLLLLGWALARTLGHGIFLFLTASVIAFLLNPLVRALQRLRIRRGGGVAVVYLSFAAAMVALIVALGTVVVEQTRSAADRFDAYLTDEPGRSSDSAFDRGVADFESWLRGQGIDVELREQVDEWLADVNVSDLPGEAISFAEGWEEDGPVPVEVEVERPKAVNAP
jgi:predicted PurR-regulated permease PerM